MIYDITRGVPKENLDDFTVCLSDSLGLDEEQRVELHARMKMMNFAKSKDSSILEMNFNMDEMRSVYGFVSMLRENDGTVAIAYAFHKLNFKMSKKTVKFTTTTTRTRKFLCFELSPNVTTREDYKKE